MIANEPFVAEISVSLARQSAVQGRGTLPHERYASHHTCLSLALISVIGSRNPYDIRGHGAGFALCWRGNPQLLIGQPNEAEELVQVISDSMLIIIPKYVIWLLYMQAIFHIGVASRIPTAKIPTEHK